MSEKEEPASFEKSLERLEQIIGELEKGDLPLDESLKRYEEGVRALRTCEAFLKMAEQRIRKLVETDDGTLQETAFELTETEDVGLVRDSTAASKDVQESGTTSGQRESEPDSDLDSDVPF